MAEISHEVIQLLLFGLAVGVVAGALAGVLAGLTGIGGGLIYVPLFYLTMPGDQDGLSMQIMASLVAIAMTGFFSARAHWRLGHLHRASLKQLSPGLMIGAVIGLWSTLNIPEAVILLGLAMLDGWVGWDFGRDQVKRRAVSLVSISVPVGYLSGTLGIGGGTMLVPLLRRTLSLREAVGTSAGCGMLMAMVAVLFNLLFEPAWLDLIVGQLHFLIAAWLGILLVMPGASGWSACLHTAMPEERMRMLLKLLFFTLSAGLFMAAIMQTYI